MENRDAKDYQGPPIHSRGIRIPKSTQVCHVKVQLFNKILITVEHSNWPPVCLGGPYSS